MSRIILYIFSLYKDFFLRYNLLIAHRGGDSVKPYERIRQLRKKILKMTLEEFSAKINMSGSNLGNIETGRIGLTERVLLDICRTFHIRRSWIETGNEPIFEDEADPLDTEISKLYSSLTDENKKYLYGYIQRLLEEQRETNLHDSEK